MKTTNLTPKRSTPWWDLLRCCRPATKASPEGEDDDDVATGDARVNNEPRTPLAEHSGKLMCNIIESKLATIK